MTTPPRLWRFTTGHPRYLLGIALWVIAAIFVMSAMRANNWASLILCIIPVPGLAFLAVAELHRATHEESR